MKFTNTITKIMGTLRLNPPSVYYCILNPRVAHSITSYHSFSFAACGCLTCLPPYRLETL